MSQYARGAISRFQELMYGKSDSNAALIRRSSPGGIVHRQQNTHVNPSRTNTSASARAPGLDVIKPLPLAFRAPSSRGSGSITCVTRVRPISGAR